MKKISTISIIDDDEIYQMFTRRVIQNLDMCEEITSYHNGQEAIDAFLESLDAGQPLPEILFLDINMPIMDGWEFMDAYRQFEHRIPNKVTIYIVSSSIAPEDQNKAKTYTEISGFMSKPMKVEEILELFKEKLAEQP